MREARIISIITRSLERFAVLDDVKRMVIPEKPHYAAEFFSRDLKALFFADIHHLNVKDLDLLDDLDYDACFFMGDIKLKYLQEIKSRLSDKPVYGILGNHDDAEDLLRGEVENLHNRRVEIGGVTFAGFEGGAKYLFGKGVMYDQEETLHMADTIPAADVLLSHDGPFHLYGNVRHHCGMQGITKYIEEKRPLYNFHGHYHINRMQTVGRTTVTCQYKCVLYDFETNTNTRIF